MKWNVIVGKRFKFIMSYLIICRLFSDSIERVKHIAWKPARHFLWKSRNLQTIGSSRKPKLSRMSFVWCVFSNRASHSASISSAVLIWKYKCKFSVFVYFFILKLPRCNEIAHRLLDQKMYWHICGAADAWKRKTFKLYFNFQQWISTQTLVERGWFSHYLLY